MALWQATLFAVTHTPRSGAGSTLLWENARHEKKRKKNETTRVETPSHRETQRDSQRLRDTKVDGARCDSQIWTLSSNPITHYPTIIAHHRQSHTKTQSHKYAKLYNAWLSIHLCFELLVGIFVPRTYGHSAEHLSAELTSLPCSIRMNRHADISLSSLVAEARRLSFNVTQSLLFALFCNCLLALLLFFCQVVLLPPLFNGLQVRLIDTYRNGTTMSGVLLPAPCSVFLPAP